MSHNDDDEDVPEEIEDHCIECHHSLASVERLLKPLLASNHAAIEDKMSPLDNASLALLVTYTMNSLFWAYLNTKGVNPKNHPLKTELDRIQKYMHRATILNQREKGEVPKIDKEAAKRFVSSSLFDEGENSKKRKTEVEKDTSTKQASKRTKK